MAAIILRDRWKSQPRGRVSVDRANCLGAKVIACWPLIGTDLFDAAGGIHGTQVGAAAVGISQRGAIHWKGDGSGASVSLASSPLRNGADPVSYAFFQRRDATAQYCGLFTTLPPGAAVRSGIMWSSDSGYGLMVGRLDSLGTRIDLSQPANGQETRVVVVCASGPISITNNSYKAYAETGASAVGAANVPGFSTQSANVHYLGWDGADSRINGLFGDFVVFDGALSEVEAKSYLAEPYQIFRKSPRILYFNTGGGTTITGSGTPTAQASTVAGTAERSVTGSGTPSAQASTVAGVAERVITSSGALSAQSSTVSGSGTVGGVFTGSGALQAQSSTVSGTAERSVTGTGTPASQAATVSGTAERVVTGTGTSASQAATVSGTGQVGNVVTGSGTPTAQAATVAGTAERTVTASGAVSAQSSTVAGTAERTITGSGSLQSQSSTVYGFDSVPVVPDTGGGGSRTVAFSSRKLRQELEEWEQKNQEKERLKRLMREDEELVMIMLALAA